VEDSSLMRNEIKRILEKSNSMEVITARNGREGVEMFEKFQPDVITMDVNMPEMDGLNALNHIMHLKPTPVIMLSSITHEGALATYEALELGAIDFIAKPQGTISQNLSAMENELISKIKSAYRANLKRYFKRPLIEKVQKKTEKIVPQKIELQKSLPIESTQQQFILIGLSTGGPNVLLDILKELNNIKFDATIIVVQHMPGNFTQGFAERMNKDLSYSFKQAKNNELALSGMGYLAEGGRHLTLQQNDRGYFFKVSQYPNNTTYTPSIDLTFRSVASIVPAERIIATIMTGMGADGAQALLEIKNKGGQTIAESEETAVVFGMPKEAIHLNAAQYILPSYEVGKKIRNLLF